MASNDWQRVKELVADALEHEPSQREAFLRDSCGDDAVLLTKAKSLLASFDDAEDFLDEPAIESLALGEDRASRLIGTEIGQYRIQRFIAEGGMGAVFEAVSKQTNRRVALKLMRHTLIAREARRRFRHEVEILGRLHHPNIAQVYDAGMHVEPTGDAAPYFVMEFIDGVKLTTYADDRRLSTAQRLELVAQVCDGVHHAHQRGIIHRDLKPDNILVDENGVPKILDFGIARLTDAEKHITTLKTEVGQLLGTISYMSPEQVLGDPDEIDTRSDVYALGVIMYQVLCGRLPHDLREKTIIEAARIIREEDSPTISSFNRLFRGDLETIVAKALEKDKSRRYQSASELGEDIRRMVRDEPILARPASTFYQWSKFARRHRALVGGVAAAFVLLVLGTVGTTIGMVRANQAAERAQRAEERAQADLTRALRAEREAREEQHRATLAEADARAERDRAVLLQRESSDYGRFLERMLASADPRYFGGEVTVRAVLDHESPRIDAEFAETPSVAARLHASFGWTYFQLGEYDAAERHMRRAIALKEAVYGPDSIEAIDEWNRLAQVLMWASRTDEADELTQRMLDRTIETFGEDHLASAYAMENRALFLQMEKRLEESAQFFERSIAILAERIEESDAAEELLDAYLTRLNNYTLVLGDLGRYSDAAQILREIAGIRQQQHGDDDSALLVNLLNLGSMLASINRFEEAFALFDDLIERGEKVWGATHPNFLHALSSLATAHSQRGDHEEARRLYQRVYEAWRDAEGAEHAETTAALNNLCVSLIYLGRNEEAVELARELLNVVLRTRGSEEHSSWKAMSTLGNVLHNLGEFEEARALLEECHRLHALHLGPDNPDTIIAQNNLARTLQDQGYVEEAAVMLEDAVDRYRRAVPDDELTLSVLQWNLGRAYHELGNHSRAESNLREARERGERVRGPNHPDVTRVLRRLAELYRDMGRDDDAAAIEARLQSLEENRTTNGNR